MTDTNKRDSDTPAAKPAKSSPSAGERSSREIKQDMEQFAKQHPYRGGLYDLDAAQAREQHRDRREIASSEGIRNAVEITEDISRHKVSSPLDPAVAAFDIDREARAASGELRKALDRKKRNRRLLLVIVFGTALLFAAWALLNTVMGEFLLKRFFLSK